MLHRLIHRDGRVIRMKNMQRLCARAKLHTCSNNFIKVSLCSHPPCRARGVSINSPSWLHPQTSLQSRNGIHYCQFISAGDLKHVVQEGLLSTILCVTKTCSWISTNIYKNSFQLKKVIAETIKSVPIVHMEPLT